MWPDVWTEPWLWAADSSPVWKTQPATLTGCMKFVNSSSKQLLPSTQRSVCHSVHTSISLPACLLFFLSYCVFVLQGKTFVKKSLHCISQAISSKLSQTIRRCNIFQRMIAEVCRQRNSRNTMTTPLLSVWSHGFIYLLSFLKVQEECYTSLDICTVARTNPDAIGDVVQVPTHFPNRSALINTHV